MRRRRDSRYDVIADSLAMVKAAHESDGKAFTFLLDAADLRSCAEFLAELSADLIGQLADGYDTEPVDLIGRIRARQLRGPSRDW